MSSLENNGLGLGQSWGAGPGLPAPRRPHGEPLPGLPWTLRGATSWHSHRQGPCQDGGQSWDTEPHNTLCCPAEGEAQATPPRPGRGSACRAGAAVTVTPSCHLESPPGSAFLGFLQCTKDISLLCVLVTALGP